MKAAALSCSFSEVLSFTSDRCVRSFMPHAGTSERQLIGEGIATRRPRDLSSVINNDRADRQLNLFTIAHLAPHLDAPSSFDVCGSVDEIPK